MSPRERLKCFRSSFQMKLFSVFTMLTAFISILICTLYITSEIRENRSSIREQVQLLTRQLADSARLPLYAENRDILQNIAETALRAPEMRAVIISSNDGRVLAEARLPGLSASTDVFSETAEVRSNPLSNSVESAFTGTRDSSGTLIGSVHMVRGANDLSRNTRRLFLISCSMAVGFWMVVSVICHLVLRKVTRSFNALVHGVKNMQHGDYTSRIAATGDDEPGRASLAINELASALHQRDQENSRLTAELLDAMQVSRESEQTLRNLMDVMPVGVGWTDLAGTIEYLNNFFVERFGYSREDIHTIDDWFTLAFPDPAYREQIVEIRRSTLAAAESGLDEVPMYEARITCKNGTIRHVLIKNQLTKNRNIVIMIDITDRELLQEQLVKSQKLESLGVLAGGIAHNFNNVLTGVLGYISFSLKFLDESHKAFKLLQEAEKASWRAAGMAKQLLTFARGGAPVKKAVSVRRLVDESVSLAFSGTNVQCLTEIPSSLHSILVDEGQISQVFNNIFINSIQAMPSGGTFSIHAENSTMACDKDGRCQQVECVRLSFSDEGCGIPEENLKKIFDPYFTTKTSGTGLGLASVHSIVYKHGGQITVHSVVGKGTVFTICLPSAGVELSPVGVDKVALASDGQVSGSILVMDDEQVIQNLAKETLEFLGYQVTTCANGDEAVAFYRESRESGEPFKAVILDLTIPCGMGGIEAAKHILEIDPAARLIVSSGYSYDPVMSGYRDYGFCAAVTKPYKADELGRELGFLNS